MDAEDPKFSGIAYSHSSTTGVTLSAHPETVHTGSDMRSHDAGSQTFRCVVSRTLTWPDGTVLVLGTIKSGLPRVGMRLTTGDDRDISLASLPGVDQWDPAWSSSLAFQTDPGVDLSPGATLRERAPRSSS